MMKEITDELNVPFVFSKHDRGNPEGISLDLVSGDVMLNHH